MTFEKRPRGRDSRKWQHLPWTSPNPLSLASSAWMRHRGTFAVAVLSEMVIAQYPDDDSMAGPQWLVSISRRVVLSPADARMATDRQCARVLGQFAMVGAEEDNHEPGFARKFWRPVDPAHRVDCQCKADEITVVEPNGYTWTTLRDGPCRGCSSELREITGRPCPLHGDTT